MTDDRIASDAVRRSTDGLNYGFHDFPRYEPPEAYEQALGTFLDRIEDVPGVVSVYESGPGVSVPGISDIDLIVVVEDDVQDPRAVRRGIEDAKPDEYFFFHGPEVLTRETFPDYYDVLPMPKDLELHYGEQLEYEKNTDEYNYLAYLVDSVTTTYPIEFLELLYFPGVKLSSREFDILINDMIDLFAPRVVADRLSVRIDTRFAIHRLNSLRNDMQLFLNATGRDVPELDRFDDAVTHLRQGWFDLPEERLRPTLLARLEDSITACFAFVDALATHLDDLGIGAGPNGTERRTMDVYPNEYRPNWERTRAERETVANCRRRRVKSCVLPSAVTANDRIRHDDPVVAPQEYVDSLRRRDRTQRRRDESMETYKYHPLRPQYMAVIERLHRLKAIATT